MNRDRKWEAGVTTIFTCYKAKEKGEMHDYFNPQRMTSEVMQGPEREVQQEEVRHI